jgi:RecG-like helicase
MAKGRSMMLLGLACGLLAGCGSATSQTPAYVAEGNAICTEQIAQLHRLVQPTTLEQTVTYLPRALAIIQRETSALATLTPTPAERTEFAAALASSRQLATLLRTFLHQLHSGMVQFATFSQVETQSSALREALDAHFRHAGLTQCAG